MSVIVLVFVYNMVDKDDNAKKSMLDGSERIGSSHAHGQNHLTRVKQMCVNLWSDKNVLRIVIVVMVVIGICLIIVTIRCTTVNENNVEQKCPDVQNKSSDLNYASNASRLENPINEVTTTKIITLPMSEPLCQFPFPKDESAYMKYYLHFEGTYSINVLFDNKRKLNAVCSKMESRYHFCLLCDTNTASGCSDILCIGSCSVFNFTVNISDVLIIEMNRGCLRHGGVIQVLQLSHM